MDWKEIVGGMFTLIILYLVLNNSKQTAQVVSAIAASTAGMVTTLQGRGSASSMNTSMPITNYTV